MHKYEGNVASTLRLCRNSLLQLIPWLVLALGTGAAAHAAEVNVYKKSSDDIALISITGTIEKGDEIKFRKIATENSSAIVLLNSEGGALLPALEIGRTIRLREYGTTVYKDGWCTSSCALIWIAGSKRSIWEGGKVGFHASYRNVDGTAVEVGMGNALVGHYLSQLGMGEKSVIFATAAPPDRVLWLTRDTTEISGISYDTIADQAEKVIATPPPPRLTATLPSNSRLGEESRQLLSKTSETLKNVKSFARLLLQNGYRAEIDRSDPKMPYIYTGISGHNIALSFSSCYEDDCEYLEIMSSWTKFNNSAAIAATQEWRNEENFSSILLDIEKGQLSVYHYVILGPDGITYNNLIKTLQYFVKDYEAIGQKLLTPRSR
jgi:hypothetical protein